MYIFIINRWRACVRDYQMAQTANILKAATRNSLVVIDEIGRGTEVEAGTAVAQAVLEHVHDDIQCRTLTATHLRGLSAVANRLERMRNFKAEVLRPSRRTTGTGTAAGAGGVDDNGTADVDDVVFTYRIVPGVATESYAVSIASWAGLPNRVITRAHELITNNKRGNRKHAPRKNKSPPVEPESRSKRPTGKMSGSRTQRSVPSMLDKSSTWTDMRP